MEETHNLVTGCLIPSSIQDELGDSEDDGGDEMQWLGYNEVTQLGHGKSLVPYERPKRFKGDLIHLQNGRRVRVAGTFHFKEPWWQTTILRTKKSKDKFTEPKDWWALCYRLRDDPKRQADRVFDLFISKIGETDVKMPDGKKVEITPWFESARRDFEAFLSYKISGDDLDLGKIEEYLEAYMESQPEELRKMPLELTSKDIPKYQHLLFKNAILQSTEYSRVQVTKELPELMHYLPQLFPGNFTKLISLDMKKLKKLCELVKEEPGMLAFKKILSKDCGVMGVETSLEALTKAGMLPKIEQEIRDAIVIYEYIKKETKENGHTYIQYNRILDVLGSVVMMFEEALVFLNKNKITKTQVENGSRHIYLMQLWQAENKIAVGITSLIEDGESTPWELKVDFESEDFDSIRGDNDQLRAAQLIASKPVVAISGKGGCGKTYVVTKVITAAKATSKLNRSKTDEAAEDKNEDTQQDSIDNDDNNNDTSNNDTEMDAETQPQDDLDSDEGLDLGEGHDLGEGEGHEEENNTSVNEADGNKSQMIELLLTAPTGKAANLLGKRAKCPSFTLHQVIFSFRNLKEGMPWKHKDVNILVVDECSLVSVSTFSFLIELLMEHAKLKRIVLLGDVRQLPSIEPGNFLADTFSSLSKLGCAVELRNNHRAESELIVQNATKISVKAFPAFHPEQFMFRKLPPSYPSAGGDDYTDQDVSEEVRKLLRHEALQNHVTSQFISFTRRICESINDLCCKHYSVHRTKEFGKYVFRTGDKICCTKNGYVNKYEEQHGVMSCYSQDEKSISKDGDEEGGVNRLVDPTEDTSLLSTQEVDQSTVAGSLNMSSAATGSCSEDNKKKPNQIRLCNGEIFFILEEVEKRDDENRMKTFLLLSDKDPQKEFQFYVDKLQLRKACKIRHAWARTIHTFQGSETDNVVYIVGNRSKRQNWQHVYTAVTRGRKSVFIIGEELTLRDAIRRSEIKRQTSLKKQLVQKLQKTHDINQTLQTTVLSQTGLNSTSASTNICHQNLKTIPEKPVNIAESLWSHDQRNQPMKNNVTSSHGDELNNTQMVTDILTSLAEDHEEGDDDDIDCDSDDSQSLLSPPVTRNKTMTSRPAAVTGGSIRNNPGPSGIVNSDRMLRGNGGNNLKNSAENINLKNSAGNFNLKNSTGKINLKNSAGNFSFKNSTGNIEGTRNDVYNNIGNTTLRTESGRWSNMKTSTENVSNITRGGNLTIQGNNMESDEKVAKQNKLKEWDFISDEEMDNISEPDSDDSQSLISPPATRSRARTKNQSNNSAVNKMKCDNASVNTSSLDKNSTSFTHLKTKSKPSRLSLRKGKQPLTMVTSSSVDNKSINQTLNSSSGAKTTGKVRYSFGKTTPGALLNKSGITPGRDPYSTASDIQFRIRTGNSPLTPGYNSSFDNLQSGIISPLNPNSSCISTPQPSSCLTNMKEKGRLNLSEKSRLSISEDIIEPKSNESNQSQWSEIDDSAYIDLDDNVGGLNGRNLDSVERPSSRSRIQGRGSNTGSSRKSAGSNTSTNSQWSEVDDDQYLGLDLEDIKEMNQGYHGNSDAENEGTEINTEDLPDLTRDDNISRSPENRDFSNTDWRESEEYCIPNTPPGPDLLETPPKNKNKSPRRKRGLNTDNNDVIGVSPIKHSLSKLKFL